MFGTKYVIDSALFGFVEGVEIVQPRPEEVDYIHETYIELLQIGKGTPERHSKLTALANTLLRRDAVDANTEFPYLDCAALHLRAILKLLLNRPN